MTGTSARPKFKYDVALSFLTQDSGLAQQIADAISPTQNVFFFPRKQDELAGTDGLESMKRVFAVEARVVVVLYRPNWGETPWTRVEKDAILDRALSHGFNFSLFVALEDSTPVPDEIPRRRIYYDLARYGLAGLAGAIKTRIADMEGETRPEAPEELAARVRRQQELAGLQQRFRTGEGARDALKEVDRLRVSMKNRVDSVNAATQYGLRFESQGSHYFRVIGSKLSIVGSWRQQYYNSLDDSEMTVTLWTDGGRWPFQSDRGFGMYQPQVIKTRDFQLNLLRPEVVGWIERDQQLESQELAAELLTWLIAEESRYSKR